MCSDQLANEAVRYRLEIKSNSQLRLLPVSSISATTFRGPQEGWMALKSCQMISASRNILSISISPDTCADADVKYYMGPFT